MGIFTFITFCILSCAIKKENSYSNSCDIEIVDFNYILTKQDSVKIKKIYTDLKKIEDSCKNCTIEVHQRVADFDGGMAKFRKKFVENFIIPKNSTKSTNKLFLVIGKNDSIKSYDFQNIKDKRIKKEILRVLNLKEMNHWISSNINGTKYDYFLALNVNIF